MKKTRRILAVIGIVLLLGMYLACLILALLGKHQATDLFRAALGATIAVPLMLYAFLMLLKVFPPFIKNESLGDENEEPATDGEKDEGPAAGGNEKNASP